MSELTDFEAKQFPMTAQEARLARIYHRHTHADIRDCKLLRGHWNVWIIGRGWVRTTDLGGALCGACRAELKAAHQHVTPQLS